MQNLHQERFCYQNAQSPIQLLLLLALLGYGQRGAALSGAAAAAAAASAAAAAAAAAVAAAASCCGFGGLFPGATCHLCCCRLSVAAGGGAGSLGQYPTAAVGCYGAVLPARLCGFHWTAAVGGGFLLPAANQAGCGATVPESAWMMGVLPGGEFCLPEPFSGAQANRLASTLEPVGAAPWAAPWAGEGRGSGCGGGRYDAGGAWWPEPGPGPHRRG